MAVVGSAYEIFDSPVGNTRENGHRDYTRRFRVETDSYNDGPAIVKAASGIPARYSRYSFGNDADGRAICTTLSASRIEDTKHWMVECGYTTDIPDPDEDGEQNTEEGIRLERPEIELIAVTGDEDVLTTYTDDGDLVEDVEFLPATSAGEVYDPWLRRQKTRYRLTISRNEDIDSFDLPRLVEYRDCVNEAIWWGSEPGTVLFTGLTVRKVAAELDNGETFEYLRVTYTFDFTDDTWQAKVLDHGSYHFKAEGNTTLVPFRDADGNAIKGFLDGNGLAVSIFTTGGAQYREFNIYKKKDFSELGLPQSFAEGKPRRR